MAKNVAKDVIKPSEAKSFRIVFLFTGQGDSAIMAVPIGDGVDDYEYVLVDCDLDKETNEVNIPEMLKDLLEGKKLSKYINTHPHKDHTGGIKEVFDKHGIIEVWHSNHRAVGDSKVSDDELQYVISKVGKSNEYWLKGSNELNKIQKSDDTSTTKKIGLIDFQIFSPAKYVCDDIEGEDENGRNKRIHEQCGVFKFIYKDKAILFTGDADKTAWKEHITDYHDDALKSDVMTASHHGSRTAFKKDSDDTEPYSEHLNKINAETLVISAPKQKDSPHDHPHDDALEIYRNYFEDENIHHLGEDPFCLVVTITEQGKLLIDKDLRLIEEYGGEVEDVEKSESKRDSNAAVISSIGSTARPHANR